MTYVLFARGSLSRSLALDSSSLPDPCSSLQGRLSIVLSRQIRVIYHSIRITWLQSRSDSYRRAPVIRVSWLYSRLTIAVRRVRNIIRYTRGGGERNRARIRAVARELDDRQRSMFAPAGCTCTTSAQHVDEGRNVGGSDSCLSSFLNLC